MPISRTRFQFSLRGLLVLTFVAALGALHLERYLTEERPIDWQPFSLDKLHQELRAGRTVLVSFTADWDISIKTPEARLTHNPKIRRLLNMDGIVPMQADMTNNPPDIAAELRRISGEPLVPVVAIYAPGRLETVVARSAFGSDEALMKAILEAIK